MPSFRSVLTPITLGLILALSACKKTSDGTKVPRGMSKEDVEAEKTKAKTQAKVNQLIVQANEALGAGRYVTARKIAEDALVENPDNADAYVVLGAANWRAGDFDASTEALRKATESTRYSYRGEQIHVTISLGLTLARPTDTLSSLLSRADRALYDAKNHGRNQVARAA